MHGLGDETDKSGTLGSGSLTRLACVYTTLIGGYEVLNEQPIAATSRLPFICLTDDPELRSETWQIRRVEPLFGLDSIRSQRDFKLRPHVHLPDFDCSIYIDNTVVLKIPPEALVEQYLGASAFCLPEHSFRDSVLEEFLEVEALGYDDQGRLFEQLNHYALEQPEVLEERPFWTAVLLRDHRDPKVRRMLDIWLAHVQRYSRRDQLSVNLAFRRAGFRPEVLRIDNHESWFHSWPHRTSFRRASILRLTSPFLSHPAARAKELARDKAADHARLAELETALASERNRTAELTEAVADERLRTAELSEAVAAERLRTAELSEAVAAERDRTAELTHALAAERVRAARTLEHSVVVVIPLYDGAAYIKRAIESVLAQTIQPAEIVVVDDGSHDDGPEIVMALPQAGRITLLRKSNGGQSSARNFGVKSSKSSLIAFLDQDDLWYPRHLECLVEAYNKADVVPVGWVYSNLDEIDEHGNLVNRRVLDLINSSHPKEQLLISLSQDMFVLPSASLITREAFEAIGGFDERLRGYEDDDLFFRMFRAGYRNVYVNEPLSQWCIYFGSSSHSWRMAESRMIYFEKLCAAFPDDLVRNCFYIRDLIAPRFLRNVLQDYAIAARTGSEKRFEVAKSDLRRLARSLKFGTRMVLLIALALSYSTQIGRLILRLHRGLARVRSRPATFF